MVAGARAVDRNQMQDDAQKDLDENFLEPIYEEIEEDEDKVMNEPCMEARVPRTAFDPLLPSAEEVAEHNVTHVPYRRWCKICNEARGREDPHSRDQEGIKDGLPEIGADYD